VTIRLRIVVICFHSATKLIVQWDGLTDTVCATLKRVVR